MRKNGYIQASTRVTGRRRWATVISAQKQVKDDEMYLILRRGEFFRPKAQGYTMSFFDAGLYTAAEARAYVEVEGVRVIEARRMLAQMTAEARRLESQASVLHKRIKQIRERALCPA